MKNFTFFTFILVVFLAGCSYSLTLNTMPHLRNVQISEFENNTSEYALAQDFQNYLVNNFQRDGRLRITTLDPDSYIEGTILDYRNEIFSYDDYGNVQDYRVSILFSIQMTDLRMQNVIYENLSLLLSEPYTPNSPNPDVFTTETQAQEKIFERTFETIIRNTLEAW
ncbi:MAG: LPS assembly lipoprotein LptE [Candidatus Cloacimonetes bacterium]|nr:LPS assembly lipoprotein LptE [Candidatus Cloacimonadota bacterium]